ncbi:MAG TPA: DUF692 domain-containing protein [Terriglobia bacterium]|jgi:hypothetical protein
MKPNRRIPERAGIGLRLPHIAEVVATRPSVGWFEIHPENFLANPHAKELLMEISHHYPVSIHTVGVSVGSANGIDRPHLKRMRELVEQVDPIFVSGHLAWSTFGNEYLNDLLPLPFNKEALQVVQSHVQEVQDVLGRPYLVENPASYVGFRSSTMNEAEFLSELAGSTGCRLLLDISNTYLSAHNMGYDAKKYIDSLPAEAISQLHLGGFTPEKDEANDGGEILIDTHAASIAGPTWDLYAYALRRFGSRPALIEWDNDLPPLSNLLGEALRADAITAETLTGEAFRANAG